MNRLILTSIISLLGISASVFAFASSSASDLDSKQKAMLEMQYVDGKGCFTKIQDKVEPVLVLLVLSDSVAGMQHDKVITALDTALARGCDIHQPDVNGISPLNAAIIQGDIALTRYLLAHGSNPHTVISSSNPLLNKRDSFSLLDELKVRAPEKDESWAQLAELLKASKK